MDGNLHWPSRPWLEIITNVRNFSLHFWTKNWIMEISIRFIFFPDEWPFLRTIITFTFRLETFQTIHSSLVEQTCWHLDLLTKTFAIIRYICPGHQTFHLMCWRDLRPCYNNGVLFNTTGIPSNWGKSRNQTKITISLSWAPAVSWIFLYFREQFYRALR